MNIPPEHLKRRRSLLLVCLVVAAILIFQAIRIWVADYRVHSKRIDQMERGVSLEPENASAWDRLGRARETDFVNPDPAGAIKDFEKAGGKNASQLPSVFQAIDKAEKRGIIKKNTASRMKSRLSKLVK